MNGFAVHLGRREFLKKGVRGGFLLAVFPIEKITLSPHEKKPLKRGEFSDGSQRKILEIVHKYGGEFGDKEGGL